jgi:hypothetical protein
MKNNDTVNSPSTILWLGVFKIIEKTEEKLTEKTKLK